MLLKYLFPFTLKVFKKKAGVLPIFSINVKLYFFNFYLLNLGLLIYNTLVFNDNFSLF